jgi:energy-coupling factor transporter ATP-binding protein EcfA2
MTTEPTPFQIALEKRRARKAAEEAAAKAVPTGLEDVIGREDTSSYDPDPLIQFVKDLPANIAIELLTDKTPKPANFAQKDGIKFRCPHSDHNDRDPSAWLTPAKGLWTCGACETGGDWIELAAATLGYRDSRGWRDRKGDWIKFRDALVDRIGWKDPIPEPIEVPLQRSEAVSTSSDGTISGVTESDRHTIPFVGNPEKGAIVPISTVHGGIDWRSLLPTETFLRAYMEAVSIDDVPEEFHFGSALLALGMALGRTVTLRDGDPVYGNLFVCVIGQSGSGKSRASRHLRTVLSEALPYERNDPTNQGAKFISNPGSGEVLYEHFSRPVRDPYDDKKIAFYMEVRGVVAFAELSGLTGRSQRTGSTLKSSLIDLYDCPPDFSISSRTHGETTGSDPYGSMMTSTQPGAIAKLVTSDDDKAGFLNRFIFLTGTPKERFALNEVTINLDSAIEKLRFIQGWGRTMFGTGGMIEWSDEAKQEWRSFFISTVAPDQANAQNDMLGRIDLLMKKLILLFAVNKLEEVASATTVREALSLYQYFVESYGYTSRQISHTQRLQEEDALLEALDRAIAGIAKKKGSSTLEVTDWPTARQIREHMNPKPTAKESQAVLDALVKIGEVQEHAVKPKVGRPSVRYARNQG